MQIYFKVNKVELFIILEAIWIINLITIICKVIILILITNTKIAL